LLIISEPEFFSQVAVERHLSQKTGGILHDARACDLLLLDGSNAGPHRADPPKPWMARALVGLVHARYNAARPILWTSSGSLEVYAGLWSDDPEGEQDAGLTGRLFEMCARSELRLEGFDWRMVGFKRLAG